MISISRVSTVRGPILRPHIGALQILEHAHHDFLFRDAPQHGEIRHLRAGQRKTFARRDGPSAVKRIDVGGVISVVELHHEMPRQPDAEHRHLQPPGDLHIHHRERDRDSGAAFQHLIQAAVQRIVIILLIAVKAQLLEQIALRGFDEVAAVVEIAQPVSQAARPVRSADRETADLRARGTECGRAPARPGPDPSWYRSRLRAIAAGTSHVLLLDPVRPRRRKKVDDHGVFERLG